MRKTTIVVTLALLLASGGFTVARAQTGTQSQTGGQAGGQSGSQAAPGSQQGSEETLPSSPLTLDVGFRVSSVDGDTARFERYQDLRSAGVNLNLFGSKEGSRWFADYEARNIGYHDQQYAASINGMGKIFANVSFFQLPLNYAFKDDGYVRTPYSVDGLQLDDATQAAVQAGTVVAWPANPTLTSAWVNKAQAIDLGSRRSQFDASVVYSATSAIDLNAGVRTYSRTGTQPWGASWGFSAATELPLTLDNRTTDFTVGAAWTNDRAGLQVSFDNSSFNNNNETITFDNPGTLTDSLTKGAARGLMAVMPSNSMWTVRGSGVAHLPAHSTITGAFATSRSEQNEPLQPITSNSLLGVTTPGRATADAKADISMFQVGFNSRPMPKTWFTARYRYRNFDNKTPAYVSAVTLFDTSITAEDSVEPSEYLDFKTQNLQLAASYSLIRYATVRFDYFFNKLDQTFREWPTVKENVERVSFDSVGLQFATLRASYEHSTRRGSGTYEVPDGQQPGARMYDDADRTRNSGLVMLTLTPMPVVGVTFSANLGKDTYDDPLQEFGLLNNKNQVYTVGLDATPNDMVSAGVSYGYEKYTAVSASRNANPAPDPSFFDPNRNWFDNHDERVHTVTANLTVAKVVPNAEVQFGYDYSHSNQGYKYSGPNITRLMGLPPAPYAVGFTGTFGQLPNVIDTINRASVNLRYFFTQRLAANITYWFDKYSVEDFATPFRLDTPGALLLGYGWRPYTAHSVFLNALYRF